MPAQRRLRVERAGTMALVQAEQQLRQAQEQRLLALDKSVADQRIELEVLGLTGGAVAALRREYELTSQLRMEAARQGVEVEQSEIDLIREKSAELGKMVDLYNQRKLAAELVFESDQIFRSPGDQQIATRMRGAGLGVDLNGPLAQEMRALSQRKAMKDEITGFATDFRQVLLSSGGDIGKAFAQSFANAFQRASEKAWDRLFDQLASSLVNALMGNGSGLSVSADRRRRWRGRARRRRRSGRLCSGATTIAPAAWGRR